MIGQDAFDRLLALLYDAALDDGRWPAASALIDETCGIANNSLVVGEGPAGDVRIVFAGGYHRGQRREALEREYLEVYYPIDERVPRARELSDGDPVHIRKLYTPEELKTSPTYNELMLRARQQDSLNVRLDGPDGSHIVWGLGDPVGKDGWDSRRIALVRALLPHIRQFVRVRQALVRAEARATTVTALLDDPRIGVIQLDRRGKILEANDRARDILRRRDGLSDPDGALRPVTAGDRAGLDGLVARALPRAGATGGSMRLGRASGLRPFVVHVKPMGAPQPDYAARHVVALVLIVEPGRTRHIDPDLVAATLGLTPTEAQVAACLAAGQSVGEMAAATQCTNDAIYWHLKQIYQKQPVSRQVDLVRLVMSVAELA